MPITVKHAFTSGKPAIGGSDKVQGPHWDADHVVSGSGMFPVGAILDYAGISVPTGWLECFGQTVAAATYPALFAALVKSATVTITIASPAVISWPGHGLKIGDDFSLITTGALPTGLLPGDTQKYRIISAGYSANAFRIALTWEGAAINTSGTQTGIHTGVHSPYGVSTGLSQFAVPDLRGMVSAGVTNMGGTQTPKMAAGYQTGFEQGVETVVLSGANLPPHNHTIGALVGVTAGAVQVRGSGTASTTGNGPGTSTPVSVMQPTEFVRKIIYTGL